MRPFIKLPSTVLFVALVHTPGALQAVETPARTEQRPNIVFIIADDLGYSDLGCYGGEAHTPNLDRLAARGVRFAQFYNMGKCEPTRATLMSGHRNTPQIGFMAERAKTFLPATLKALGYRTLMAGKWHVSRHPMDRGFDRFFGLEEGHCDYRTGSGKIQLGREKHKIPEKFYTTDAFTDYALTFLEEAEREHDAQPFFLYLAYTAPHTPLQAPAEEVAKYRGRYREGWEVFKERRFQRVKTLGLIPPESRKTAWPQNLPHWDELTDAQKDAEDLRMATYTAMIDRMDQNIGRLMAWLEAHDEWERTLIIFVSDNGANPFGGGTGTAWAHVSGTPFRLYKRNQHEGGICAPMIMRWPDAGYAPGSITQLPVHVLDFLPTFHTLAGGTQRPEGIEGVDLAALWKAGATTRPFEMMGLLTDHRYIRHNNWKLVSVDGQLWELFNLDTDRTETDNLIMQNPEKARELQTAWENWVATFSKTEPNTIVKTSKNQTAHHMGDLGSGQRYTPSAQP